MPSTDTKKCAHPPCSCVVPDGKKYCCQRCEDAGAAELEISCDCGHAGCSLTP